MRSRTADPIAWSRRAGWVGMLGVLLPLLLVSLVRPASASPAQARGPVVLVGVPGLTWSDVTADGTPALWSLLEDGAVGTLAARSVRASACPADGWLAVSAARRAADSPRAGGVPCRGLGDPVNGRLLRWPIYLEEAEDASYAAHPGLLGDLLAEENVLSLAIGPGAAIALAGSAGRVAGEYEPRPAEDSALAELVSDAVASPGLVVIDAGALVDSPAGGASRLDLAAVLDGRVAAVLEATGPGITVMVAALADSGSTPRLDLLAVRGSLDDEPATGLIQSPSTRQPGIAQTLDLTATLVDLLGLPPPSDLVGGALDTGSDGESAAALHARLVGLEAASAAARPLVAGVFLALVVAHLGFMAMVALIALHRGHLRRVDERPWPYWLAVLAVSLAAVPASTFLAHLLPWWRWGGTPVFVGVLLLVTALISTVVLAGPWSTRPLVPMALVGGLTAAVLSADVLTGSRLTVAAPMGLQPLVAGRFYGFGNVQFALFVTGCMLVAIVVADRALRAGRRRFGALAVAGIGLFAIVVVGSPGLGSDFGGPPAIVPMFGLFTLVVAGLQLRPGRVLAVMVGALLVMIALAVGDWLRPAADRTHLGRFVASVLDGEVGPILARKLSQNVAILVGSPQTLLALGSIALVVLVLFRPRRWGGPALAPLLAEAPMLAPGMGCLLVGLGIGTAINDSGIVVLAMGAILAVPLLVAARCARSPRETPRPEGGSATPRNGPVQTAETEVEQTAGG